jgi:formylglycine-generating enzyme required for sulfatase activity
VARGGSFGYAAAYARSANRVISMPGFRDHDIGLRPARVITE